MQRKEKRALLYGMLIGDGCLKTKTHTKKDGQVSKYYEYVLCHSEKQKEYLEHKLEIFHSIVGGKKPKIHFEQSKLGRSYRFSRCHRAFRLHHKNLYGDKNSKTLTRKVLDWLTPQAIAIWYMDDGGVAPSYRVDGTISSCQMRLATYCSEEQADIILTWFREVWGVEGKKYFHKKSSSWYLGFNTKASKKLEEVIAPYIIPSMLYKLPSHRVARVPDTQTGCAVGDDIVSST
jgi:recombination protein RecA